MSGFIAQGLRRHFARAGLLFGIALALAAMMSPQSALGVTIYDNNFPATSWTTYVHTNAPFSTCNTYQNLLAITGLPPGTGLLPGVTSFGQDTAVGPNQVSGNYNFGVQVTGTQIPATAFAPPPIQLLPIDPLGPEPPGTASPTSPATGHLGTYFESTIDVPGGTANAANSCMPPNQGSLTNKGNITYGVYIYGPSDIASVTSGAQSSQYIYLPAGAQITSIDFSIDYSCPPGFGIQGPTAGVFDCPWEWGQQFGAALRQNGQNYIAGSGANAKWAPYSAHWHVNTGVGLPDNLYYWRTFSISTLTSGTTLTATDFNNLQPSDPNFGNPYTLYSHPDFSCTGGPIQFGFFTYGNDLTGGYDNWSVTIHTQACPSQTASLTVSKDVIYPPNNPLPSTQFPMTVSCTDPTTGAAVPGSPFNPSPTGNGPNVVIPNLPVGSVCTFTETPLPPPPAPPSGCTWLAPVYNPANASGTAGVVTIAGGVMNYAGVTNQYTCVSQVGKLNIQKSVVTNGLITTGVPWPFNVTYNCTNGGPSGVAAIASPGTPGWTSGNITTSTINPTLCTVNEPTPASITGVSACQGGSASWTTAYSVPNVQTAGIAIPAGATAVVTVTNTLQCDQGYLKICKVVSNQTWHPAMVTLPSTYPINLKCSNNSSWYPTLWLAAGPGNCSTNFPPATIPGTPPSPAGIQCFVQEDGSFPWNPSPPVPSNGGPFSPILTTACGDNVGGAWTKGWAYWTTTFANNPAIIPVNNPPPNPALVGTITVTNTLQCYQKSTLRVTKQVTPPQTWPNGTTFTLNAHCTINGGTTVVYNSPSPDPSSPPISNSSTTWQITGLPVGASCVITEATATPASFVAGFSGKICTWSLAAPSSPVTIGSGLNTVPMNNSYSCTYPTPSAHQPGTPPPSPQAGCPDGQELRHGVLRAAVWG